MEVHGHAAAHATRAGWPARSATGARTAAACSSRPGPSCSPPAAAGRMYKVTSNSWEGTGDGIALAYEAGAELRDMELVQFHPTGHGLAARRARHPRHRGRARRRRRPPQQRTASASCCATIHKKHGAFVARRGGARDLRRGAGGPRHARTAAHTWTSRIEAGDFIKRKLPSMYEQFLKLANVDITKEPMEVAPTIHYAMGGIRVEAETGATSVPGCIAAGEAAARPPRRQPPGRQLADRPARLRQARRRRRGGHAANAHARPCRVDDDQVERGDADAAGAVRAAAGENPYKLSSELQDVMTTMRRSSRDESGMQPGPREDPRAGRAREPMRHRRFDGRGFNPGWHTARRPASMLVNAEAAAALRAGAEGKPRRASRDPTSREGPRPGASQHGRRATRRTGCEVKRAPARADAAATSPRTIAAGSYGRVHARGDASARRSHRRASRSGAATPAAGRWSRTRVPVRDGHGRAGRRAVGAGATWRPTSPFAGTARPPSAGRARPRSTASHG